MRQEPVHPVPGDGELRVVVIVGVYRDAVRKRGEAGRQFHAGADDGAAALAAAAERFQIGAHDTTGFGCVACKRETDPVEYGALAQMHDLGRYAPRPCIHDEAGDVLGQ